MAPDGPEYGQSPAAAEWLVGRVTGELGHVTGVVPVGYPAYARLLHPADGADGPVPWARVAEVPGTRVHALAQWHRVVRSSGVSAPPLGRLEPEVLTPLVAVLARHTTTPDDCWFCLWEGYADLQGSPAVAVLGAPEPVPPAVSRAVLDADRVLLPVRSYLLGRGPLTAGLRNGWSIPPRGWFDPQSPNLFWPADRAWVVGSEIDFDSTLIAGSKALVADLLAAPELEAWAISSEDSLRADGDDLNEALAGPSVRPALRAPRRGRGRPVASRPPPGASRCHPCSGDHQPAVSASRPAVTAPGDDRVLVAAVESDDLDAATRRELRRLWRRAFGDRFSDEDAEHAYGGVHVLARDEGRLIAHASAVPRLIKFGEHPGQTIGYVEAVATDPERQGQGTGRRVMQRLHEEIAARWPAAMLSTGRAKPFYAALGWEEWAGISCTRTGTAVVPDGEHGGLMVLRLDPTVAPDLSVAVTCEDRAGDAW